jgi:chromosome segregation ATPase
MERKNEKEKIILMEYTKVTSLVPNGEHFDATAVDGSVWLTEGHLNNVETALANQDTVVQQMQGQIDEAKQATTAVQSQLDAANTTIGERDTTISDLQQQIATLKKAPAGDFKEKEKEKDDHGGGTEKVESEATKENKKRRASLGMKNDF